MDVVDGETKEEAVPGSKPGAPTRRQKRRPDCAAVAAAADHQPTTVGRRDDPSWPPRDADDAFPESKRLQDWRRRRRQLGFRYQRFDVV